MARSITKEFGSKSVEMIIRRFADGELVEETYTFDNCKSVRAAENALRKQLGTTNFMVVSSTVKDSGASKRYTMDAEDFEFYSDFCEDGKTYGHDTITVTFKLTVCEYYTLASMEPQEFTYVGVTTERKLRKAISDAIKDENILVGDIVVQDVRKWMTRDAFIEHAKEC